MLCWGVRNRMESLSYVCKAAAEIVTYEELQERVRDPGTRGYVGFEPSGLVHIGWLIWMRAFKHLKAAGIDMYLLSADWHAWINEKLRGNLDLIELCGDYVIACIEAYGVNVPKDRVIHCRDYVNDPDYWHLVLKIAKMTTLARIKRAVTIAGRKESEAEANFSLLLYPCLQVADIFYHKFAICLGGTDQRKAHMLARDVSSKLGLRKPTAIHTPLLSGLRPIGATDIIDRKMSKSKPESCIFLHDNKDSVRSKIRRAYCPPKVTDGNPIVEIATLILLPEGTPLIVRLRDGSKREYLESNDLINDYANNLIHPLDLKEAVASALVSFLEPIQEKLKSDDRVIPFIKKVSSFEQITR